ncbi:zinc finger protein ZFPM2-like isoform X3 [Pecten maximus]|uniref:zinc finger protein ZFPM2-like isoform X3 n=1 Tax=Pecten maximus TaxID=6579 RepID=UPI0014584A89|nr:zinc finger protein ZFPM2-like isoform X3 [Pecten maximus]
MVNTKTTPMKACPMCKFRTAGTEELREHLVMCGLKHSEKNAFACTHCNFTTTKQVYLTRHEKRHIEEKGMDKNSQPETVHVSNLPEDKQTAGSSDSSSSSSSDSDDGSDDDSYPSPKETEDWQKQDPGSLLSEESEKETTEPVVPSDNRPSTSATAVATNPVPPHDSLMGRVIRKSTKPTLPFHKKRIAEQSGEPGKRLRATDLRHVIPKPVTLDHPTKRHTSTVSRRFVSVGVQTEPAMNKTKRTVTTTCRYHEAGKQVKQTTVDETYFYLDTFTGNRE